MPNCPFDGSPLQPGKGLPEWLDLNKLTSGHPMPLLGGFVKSRINEAERDIEGHVYGSDARATTFSR